MERMGAAHNQWAVSQLGVMPGDRILEIGFGPGVAVRLLAERVASGFVAGVDPSPVMVRQGRSRNANLIRAGRVDLREGSVSALPFPDSRFDKVLSVNNIMLWPDLPANLREVFRVLKPGGLLVIALNPRWAYSLDDVRDMGAEIVSHVTNAGFVAVKSRSGQI